MFAPPASAASASAQMRSSADLEPVGAVCDRPGDVDRVRLEDVRLDLAQALELVVAQDRVVDHELARVLGRLVEQVPLGADERLHAHHDRLADRVDRRVRHLREELLEVRVEERPPVGEHGERRVVAHRARPPPPRSRRAARASPSCPPACSRRRAAARRSGSAERRAAARSRQVGEPHVLALEPLAVGLRRGDLALHLGVRDDAALRRGRRGRACPGCSRPLRMTLRRRDVEHAGLGGEHDPAVGRLEPAPGTQAVAVERRADQRAVGERDRGRARPTPRSGTRGSGRSPARSSATSARPAYASGTIIISACGSERPASTSSSSTLSNVRGVGAARADRPAAPSRGRRRRAPRRAATRARASS